MHDIFLSMAHRSSSVTEQQQVAFFKVGGTWDMAKNVQGRLIGSGGLDDIALSKLEHKLYAGDATTAEECLSREMEAAIKEAVNQPLQLSDKLSWVPHIDKYVDGHYYPLYSGDSSHLRASLIAPLVNFFLHFANDYPSLQALGAQGTDTADSALLPLLDAFLFDTQLKPIMLTGANRSQYEWNSDAPKNFSDLSEHPKTTLTYMSYVEYA